MSSNDFSNWSNNDDGDFVKRLRGCFLDRQIHRLPHTPCGSPVRVVTGKFMKDSFEKKWNFKTMNLIVNLLGKDRLVEKNQCFSQKNLQVKMIDYCRHHLDLS